MFNFPSVPLFFPIQRLIRTHSGSLTPWLVPGFGAIIDVINHFVASFLAAPARMEKCYKRK